MITLLAKFFLKEDLQDEGKRRKDYGTLCCIVGIALNILLFAGKYFSGVISGSVAIRADAFNNLSDAASSLITFFGFWFAGRKPDREHPFGHGRFEYLSGLGVAVLILVMGVELAKDSVGKIMHPAEIQSDIITIVILGISIAVKLYMAFYNNTIGRKMNSSAMKATAVDSISDVVATTVVLISICVHRLWEINVDGVCGLLVSLFVIYAGYHVIQETISPLLGQQPEKEFVERIKAIVLAHEGICGIHDLIVHDYGPGRTMISLHAEVPGDGDIFQIHDLIDVIENELHEQLGCEAVIHMDPVEVHNENVRQKKQMIQQIVQEIDGQITIHDFRMSQCEGETKFIFDVLVPYSVLLTDEEIKRKIQEQITDLDKAYRSVIHVDRGNLL